MRLTLYNTILKLYYNIYKQILNPVKPILFRWCQFSKRVVFHYGDETQFQVIYLSNFTKRSRVHRIKICLETAK